MNGKESLSFPPGISPASAAYSLRLRRVIARIAFFLRIETLESFRIPAFSKPSDKSSAARVTGKISASLRPVFDFEI
jgi:hypothetical protein